MKMKKMTDLTLHQDKKINKLDREKERKSVERIYRNDSIYELNFFSLSSFLGEGSKKYR